VRVGVGQQVPFWCMSGEQVGGATVAGGAAVGGVVAGVVAGGA
jgi:hypothetical protein